MHEYALLICAVIAIVGTLTKISIAEAAQARRPQRVKPQRIMWDDHVEAKQ